MTKDKVVKYCRYCGEEFVKDEDGHLVCPESEECAYRHDPYAYCPRCGDRLGENTTHCSCDKQD